MSRAAMTTSSSAPVVEVVAAVAVDPPRVTLVPMRAAAAAGAVVSLAAVALLAKVVALAPVSFPTVARTMFRTAGTAAPPRTTEVRRTTEVVERVVYPSSPAAESVGLAWRQRSMVSDIR
jgi:hypothetical protein